MTSHRDDIDLPREELRDLVADVVDDGVAEPFGLYVGGTTTTVGHLARLVEAVVFEEAFGNTPEVLEEEYGRYQPASVFFCVIDHRRRLPVGMARCIVPTPVGLKSLDDIGREWAADVDDVLARTGLDLDRSEAWDCATIATLPDYRRGALQGLISMSLQQAVATAPLRFGFRWWLSILDLPVYRLIQWKMGRPFSPYVGVEAGPYLGSAASLPVWSDIDEWSARVFRGDPDLFELVFGGKGIDAVVAAPDWQAAEALVAELASAGLPRRPATPTPRV
jgi:hypothetical protein